MSKIPEKIDKLNEALKKLSGESIFQNAKDTVNSLIQLMGIEDEPVWRTFTDTNGRIVSNGAWLKKAEGFADRRGAYKLNVDEKFNIDLKAYWANKKIDKSKISMLVALTPNFEDEPFYSTKNIGIDFIIPEVPDRITVVLSKNYIIRTVELHESLSVTQQEIFAKWLKITDFSNKSQLHELLWQSFDLESVNKQFYKGICEYFTELKQHLVSKNVFDSRHAAYFTNRLIGRIVFCRFLDKKGIINPEMKYFETEGKDSTAYYRDKLETLFFNVFNTPIDDRQIGTDDKTPFLNGGLFEIKENDKYKDDNLTFPSDYFSRLFEFLKHYNFTTDESTSAFQQVAIDPEMLGKIFENLLAEQVEETGEQARKAKGAFYTPREIVDYMCKESLREYLKTQLTEARDRDDKISLLLDTKPHLWRDQQRNYVKDLEPFKIQIFKALDSVKILDPACGSGAFPMGMMQLLLLCYERLEPRFDPYSTKLSIIKNNLYGVDIEPMAVEISRLRAWLSIIVDKEGDIRKIEPLPNLDFKFVCANSLIPLEVHHNLTDDTDLRDQISAIRDEYYEEKTVKGKSTLRNKFIEMLKLSTNIFEKSNLQIQIESYKPFELENVCSFFDPGFMFGLDKFHIIIGNPPYIESRNSKLFPEELKKKYIESAIIRWDDLGKKLAKGSDLLIYFFEFSLAHLSKTGINTFITQNSWLSTDYGYKFQTFLKSLSLEIEVIDSDSKHFDSVTGPNINTVISKIKKSEKFQLKFGKLNLSTPNMTSGENIIFLNDPVVDMKWSVVLKSNETFLNVIKKLSKQAGFEGYSIGQGLNLDKSYYTDKECLNNIEEKYIYPILTSKDGAHFITKSTTHYLVSSKDKAKILGVSQFIPEKRITPDLILPRGLGRFFCSINEMNCFTSSYVEIYIKNRENKKDLLNLWCFLNSTLGYLIREISGRCNLGGGMLKAEATDLKKFPLLIDFKKENLIKGLIDQNDREALNTLDETNTDMHKKIDNIVFSHFSMTEQEKSDIIKLFSDLVNSREEKSKT